MVRWEALLVAVLGGIIGVVIGVVLGIALQRALGEFGITRLVIPLPLIVVVLLVSGLAGLVAAIYPAWRAGRLAILDAIGTE
jgi:putative ABC transport system permease protein